MNQRPGTIILFLCLASLLFVRCDDSETPPEDKGRLQLSGIRIGTYNVDLSPAALNENVPADRSIIISFASSLDTDNIESAVTLADESGENVPVTLSFLDNNKTISLAPAGELKNNKGYTLVLSDQIKGINGENFPGIEIDFKTVTVSLEISSWSIGGTEITGSDRIVGVSLNPSIEINFSNPLDPATVTPETISLAGKNTGTLAFDLSNENKTLTILPSGTLDHFGRYQFVINDKLKGEEGEVFEGLSREFYTAFDPTPKFPVVSDDELLTLIQQQTFNYFWDFAHPASGMARERNTSGDLVTSGGSGFGIMALIVGIERNFITRQQGLERLDKILNFLETADRFHGVWPHWMNGNTGDVIPFSPNDNGGDLVETSFLVQGLLTFRQYLDPAIAGEQILIDRINTLWEGVEWDWYTREGQDVLYWHWSPDKEWTMNHQIKGYNEALITYVLAAASPTHAIDAEVYHEGWAGNGGIVNGKSFYDITLPVGYDYGGPLFFTHYSFLGLDPRNLQDTYANYWTQNVNHSRINHAYCADNPKNFVGYSDACWGLTASDNHEGYSAHSPTNDLGVITPTAALSSFPYTPEESMKALKFFYYTMDDKLWGEHGFYDAFNVTEGWVADSYLAIDQGPIVVMMENHRTGRLWDLFMSCPEVQNGLTNLGFTY